MRSLGILLALVLAAAAMPTAFSYQEDHKQVSQDHDKLSFGDFSNKTLSFDDFTNKTLSFDDFSNKTHFPFDLNKTNYGQSVSYFEHQINYFKQEQKEIANTIKEQLKDDKTKLQEQFKTLKQDVSANKVHTSNLGQQIKTDKTNQDEKGSHLGHR
ncbi:MAG: hypothetical protein ACREBI_10815 [Nitrosotalea sp.]